MSVPLAAPPRVPARPRVNCVRTTAAAATFVGLTVALWSAVAVPARATYGARTTADEPQYLLTALSLAEDRDLWIDDELADQRYRPFHEAILPVQTKSLADGHAVSPHDPLLPTVLAVPMGLGGWAAAKATLAALAGVLAGLLVWVARRRLDVPLGVAAATVLLFGLAAPLSAYSTQVYPELPAALAVTVAIATLTGPFQRRAAVAFALAVAALPWLGVKYVPIAAALTVTGFVGLLRHRGARSVVVAAGGLAAAGLAYVLVHHLIYGGWTVYSAGDHFVGGELTVVGNDPNYLGRTRRLAGLLLDRGFGLAAWMPAYLLAVPALGLLARRRPSGWLFLVAPLAAGWATATWAALTMHGWWWPGRQVVVVAPCLVLVVAWWAGQVRRGPTLVALGGALGVLSWAWLVIEALARRLTLVVDFETTANPWVRTWRHLLPDYRHPDVGDWLLQAGWLVVLGLAVVLSGHRSLHVRLGSSIRRPTHVPA